jgi:hypothetical protein
MADESTASSVISSIAEWTKKKIKKLPTANGLSILKIYLSSQLDSTNNYTSLYI